MPISYMGSKRRLASRILDTILLLNPECKYFFDLFGGGSAVSEEALKRGLVVTYNDLNTGVCELLKDIRDNGVRKEYFNWVSREEFFKHKDDKTWYGGLLKTCWSFGNNAEKGYMFGKDIEPLKKEAHDYLFANGYDRTAKTRVELLKKFKKEKGIEYRLDIEQLQQLQQLEQLEQLQRLQQLQQLQQLERLEILNQSYEQVPINTPISETVIYCDIPYKNTAKYNKLDFNHDKFYDWVNSSKYKIYISSYESHLHKVAEWEHRSTLSATNNNKKVVEVLYSNRKENIPTLFDWGIKMFEGRK